jgi:hypothetical protein
MKCKLRNVSTTFSERYQTFDGNVRVERFKRNLWSVMPRGQEPFMVRSKKTAFAQACGIAAKRRR